MSYARSAGAHLDAARARVLIGCALARAGERERATVELSQAAEELSACGAKRLLDEASAHLRPLGRRLPIRRTADPRAKVVGLTAREDEIAHLVSRGKTNREVVPELVEVR
jgi:DNA-binding NarL/FixJ family response regulator